MLWQVVVCLAQIATECRQDRDDIWFGLRFNLAKLQRINQSLPVGPSNIQPSSVVRDLGVYLDSRAHNKTTHRQNCCRLLTFYHIRRLRQVRRHSSPK